MTSSRPTVVCIASYEKGQPFLEQLAQDGCKVILLTANKLRDAAWPWTSIAETHTFSDSPTPPEVLKLVQGIARGTHIDRVIALDEFDLEAAALVREDLRLPGMGQSTTRYFRDKLAMRTKARQAGIRVPDFIGVHTHADLDHFLKNTKGPWLLKPRTSASAIGLRSIPHAAALWKALEEIGEEQTSFLLETFVVGDVFHVDSIAWGRKPLLQVAHAYGTPPMQLMHGGGVFTTRTLERRSGVAKALRALDAELVTALGLVSGVTHSEYIQCAEDGQIYFLETAARVGGAFIAELVEFATGANPWREWAKIECSLAHGTQYKLHRGEDAYAGSVICLARQEEPDLSGYDDPEVIFRLPKHHHAGLIVRSGSAVRVEALLSSYRVRFEQDFCTSMPAPDKPTS